MSKPIPSQCGNHRVSVSTDVEGLVTENSPQQLTVNGITQKVVFLNMTTSSSPELSEPHPVPLRGESGVTIRAAEKSVDPVFAQSLPVGFRRQVYARFRDAATNTADESQAADIVDAVTTEESVTPVSAAIQEAVYEWTAEKESEPAPVSIAATISATLRASNPQATVTVTEDWTKRARDIQTRINTFLEREHSDSASTDVKPRESVLQKIEATLKENPQLVEAAIRRTIVKKPTEEKPIPDFILKARAFSGAAASKVDPNDGNLFKRFARTPEAEESVVDGAGNTAQQQSSLSPISQQVELPIVPVKENAVENNTIPVAVVEQEPIVEVARAVATEAPAPQGQSSPTVSSARSSEVVEQPEPTEDDERKAAQAEWINRATTIKQRIPEYWDDNKSDLKREALAQVREQHKNSRSLISQLAKTPTQKAVRASAQQKRNAYTSFAAAPAHFRNTWLPAPSEPAPTFDVVSKTRTNSNASADVPSQVFRSKSNVGENVTTGLTSSSYSVAATSDSKIAARSALLDQLRNDDFVGGSENA